jgi:hypothetical protein
MAREQQSSRLLVAGSRLLQFATSGAAGGLFVGQEDIDANRTVVPITETNADTNEPADRDNLDRVKAFFLILLSGVGIVLGLIVITYLVMILLDKCTRRGDAEEERDHGVVSRKAGLWGLKQSERQAILEYIFRKHKTVFEYSQELVPAGNNSGVDAGEAIPVLDADVSTTSDSGRDRFGNETTSKDSPAVSEKDQGIISEPLVESSRSIPGRAPVDEHQDEHDTAAFPEDDSDEDRASHDNHFSSATTESSDDLALTEHDDNDHDRVCCICLAPYEAGSTMLTARTCPHQFHYDCCMEWLVAFHDHCPYCRVEMMTPNQMRKAARKVLGQARVTELGMWQQYQQSRNDHNTDPTQVRIGRELQAEVELTVQTEGSNDQGAILDVSVAEQHRDIESGTVVDMENFTDSGTAGQDHPAHGDSSANGDCTRTTVVSHNHE